MSARLGLRNSVSAQIKLAFGASVGGDWTEAFLKVLFQALDDDANGVLDYGEFQEMSGMMLWCCSYLLEGIGSNS